jgi:hypothetical protein
MRNSFTKISERFISILLVAIVPSYSFAQVVKPFPQGIGFEIGGGHNSATWHYSAASPERGTDNEISRSQFWFWFTPTARLSYTVSPFESTELVPFVEFNIFGGRSKEHWGYEDAYLFEAIGIGVLSKISVFGFSVGPGIKVNRHLKVYGKLLKAPPNADSGSLEVTDSHRRTSIDVGARVGWNFSHWSLAGESWFGLTQLQSEARDQNVEIYQRHFRILLGYQL